MYADCLIRSRKPAAAPQTAPEIVKKDTADAVKAYSLVAPKPKNYDKKSLEELKTELVQQGKIEGKDFKVEQDNLMSKLILLENDKPVKEYIYNQKGASKEDFETVREFGYPLDDKNGLQSIETTYGADGEFHFRTMNYKWQFMCLKYSEADGGYKKNGKLY